MTELELKQLKADMQGQLIRYFMIGNNDEVTARKRLMTLADSCKKLGIPIGDNVVAFRDNPNALNKLMTYSDMGMLGSVVEAVEQIKNTKN